MLLNIGIILKNTYKYIHMCVFLRKISMTIEKRRIYPKSIVHRASERIDGLIARLVLTSKQKLRLSFFFFEPFGYSIFFVLVFHRF